ncbi:30S ribosomal protein S9 [Helicobacter saguini]|uniref:Small ribosomal subunit protein uS9 n=1 Tax=Helicobacter saguini TaxID=1548018 RepID=A0A347VPN6_9HELI|nr:30S ribosomal protein S9 [Helicobacter saguini]MWV61282.1 30S ribosomal protein S9 [Helicobacter saguini]MWV68051.1 30S ribosomal protein S9 [Helicobacter saguini]MWV70486.1 30S ribosomal protein S9 [Helicobacter saguini]MWV72387.1 30S ribosomal protein S9 [Helicobacter saguini]TLD92348.1 30S ribosomal protein S9 [Helicobacter saguini]
MSKIYATGKRKTAVAKVWLKPGSGKILINGIGLDEWLGGHDSIKMKVMQPLVITKQDKSVDITAVTLGGGYSAQADALRSGIAKALNLFDREAFRKDLKVAGLLTRDARVVERKKYGKRKARRSPQFSKR